MSHKGVAWLPDYASVTFGVVRKTARFQRSLEYYRRGRLACLEAFAVDQKTGLANGFPLFCKCVGKESKQK